MCLYKGEETCVHCVVDFVKQSLLNFIDKCGHAEHMHHATLQPTCTIQSTCHLTC